ncbi:MAG: hypothetical protein FJW36_01220 [Acidobacteria bacterium]|nr:hypothetical protein [Acidobacteriota bacterium]
MNINTLQPLFIDLNPPQNLTSGDQLELPVTVRNYSPQARDICLDLQPGGDMNLETPRKQNGTLEANSSRDFTYRITAGKTFQKSLFRATALAGSLGDAIEKSSRIHPDGHQLSKDSGDLMVGNSTFEVVIPANAIPGGNRAELRIHPNFTSLLLESAHSILKLPHGCAEQTISAGYANLTVLLFARSTGKSTPELEDASRKHIRTAQLAISAMQSRDGGIPYWTSGTPDLALSAYALSFLLDSSPIVPVAREQIERIIAWLEQSQSPSGLWTTEIGKADTNNRHAILLTSHILRALGEAATAGFKIDADTLHSGLHHLSQQLDTTNEPYLLANLLLAVLASGKSELGVGILARLNAAAQSDRGAKFWDTRTNTPFYGWGVAGRFETTSLVVRALSAWNRLHPDQAATELKAGLIFLLRNRDQSGGWGTTHATALTMQAIAVASPVLGDMKSRGRQLEIRAAGRLVQTLRLPSDPKTMEPLLVDLSASLNPGKNSISVSGTTAALVYLSESYWLPWAEAPPSTHPELQFKVSFDRLDPAVGEPVRCSVRAERVGFKGYGMLIAEIGLPPGTQPDTTTLEQLLEGSARSIDHYEIHPDKLIFYFWPKAGGIEFDFLLTPRFRMRAKSTPSALYDYYNPEAISQLAPTLWTVR